MSKNNTLLSHTHIVTEIFYFLRNYTRLDLNGSLLK